MRLSIIQSLVSQQQLWGLANLSGMKICTATTITVSMAFDLFKHKKATLQLQIPKCLFKHCAYPCCRWCFCCCKSISIHTNINANHSKQPFRFFFYDVINRAVVSGWFLDGRKYRINIFIVRIHRVRTRMCLEVWLWCYPAAASHWAFSQMWRTASGYSYALKW